MKELPQIVQQRKISKKSKISVSPRNLLEGYIHNISLSSSTGIKAPTQIEDGNFRLSTRFLGHHSTALNQPFRKKKKKKKLHFLHLSLPKLPIKLSDSSELLSVSRLFLLGAANSNVSACLASLCIRSFPSSSLQFYSQSPVSIYWRLLIYSLLGVNLSYPTARVYHLPAHLHILCLTMIVPEAEDILDGKISLKTT